MNQFVILVLTWFLLSALNPLAVAGEHLTLEKENPLLSIPDPPLGIGRDEEYTKLTEFPDPPMPERVRLDRSWLREMLDLLGRGGMGEVYRARDSKLGREVAIKVLHEAFAKDTEQLARFEREARVLAALDHPHIGGQPAHESQRLDRALAHGGNGIL